MTGELKRIYIDEVGNLQFRDQLLEELNQEQRSTVHQTEPGTLEKLLEKLIENREQSLKHIAEKFEIEKCTSKNVDANQWTEIFEKECIRVDVTRDEQKIEILRLFMEKSCLDSYSSMIIKLTMNSGCSNSEIIHVGLCFEKRKTFIGYEKINSHRYIVQVHIGADLPNFIRIR